ncbi:ferredoxin--NADP reductase [Uliginosibacterium sp. 31-16]|uniref:ferredoxin--NADP reductase n=1 Tax=Uliginosibacterium sp. 31-16 TaxID=3068315 RepID=UPI00273FF73B|nr:ferredoxin--NADP reductase [Uliginosibacterium sp. 31-16]MDP5238182.1 ferredoxin--NADP reductase [Uliginosibacterium sp. 31-16]
MLTSPEPLQRQFTVERIERLQYWSPTLWSLRITRPQGFRFQPGHYARLGLSIHDAEKPGTTIWRPYSIVSAAADDGLDFLITLLPGGAFTSQLASCAVGQSLALESAALGFFVVSQLSSGEDLWMLATGAGLGPYVSLLRTEGVLQRFSRLVLVHAVRHAADLAYADELYALAGASGGRLRYLPIVTCDPGVTSLQGRIPALLSSGELQAEAGVALEAAHSRVMVCGNPDFTADMRKFLSVRGFQPCRRGLVGSMLFENYW